MLVTNANDRVTHAVISTNKVIDFGISNSAEFFHILSSTLYSDQILAVVREVICNAWDAHIDAKLQDKPIDIKLETGKLIIKDYGPGIYHEDIGPIYGVYGASTKLKKADNTGGFGLGCKAPFAYTDSFEVTSCHEGTKTIYRMSRSNNLADGKPGIIPIASFPTDETGLTVSIDIDAKDFSSFHDRIISVLNNGQIKATINGELFDNVLDYSKCINNYLLTTHPFTAPTNIYVKYGSVVYPVNYSKELENYEKVQNLVNNFQLGNWASMSLILLAPPNSISVTPSRETLSMQEHTIETLNNLLNDFYADMEEKFNEECLKIQKENIDKLIKEEPSTILTNKENLSNLVDSAPDTLNMVTIRDLAKANMYVTQPKEVEYKREEIKYRIQKTIDNKIVDKGLGHYFLRQLDKYRFPNMKYVLISKRNIGNSLWVHKKILKPLVTKLYKHDLLTENDLYVYSPAFIDKQNRLCPVRKFPRTSVFMDIPLLKKEIVLCTNKSDFDYRIGQSKHFNSNDTFLFYRVSRKKGAIQEAKSFFEDQGYRVHDFCKLTAHIEKRASEPKRKRPTGLPKLSCVKRNDHLRVFLGDYLTNPGERIKEPEVIVLITPANANTSYLPGYSYEITNYIVSTYGDIIGIARSHDQLDRYIKKGAVSLNTFLEKKVLEYYENNTRIRELHKNSPNVIKNCISNLNISYNTRSNLVPIFFENELLMQHIGIKYDPTEEEEVYLKLLDRIPSASSKMLALIEEIDELSIDEETANNINALMTSPYIRYFDFAVINLDRNCKQNLFADKKKGEEFINELLLPLLTLKEST